MDTIQSLISQFLDDELTDDDVDQLARFLRSDANAIDRLVLDGFVHSHLSDWSDQLRVQDDAIFGAADASDVSHNRSRHFGLSIPVEDIFCNCSELSEEPELVERSGRLWPQSMAARAAALIVAVGLAFAVYAIASRPVVVAQLTQANACQWDSAQSGTNVGALLESGQTLKLVKGQALLTFVNGAQMLLEGPVSLRLDTASEVALQHGFIATKVPTPAIGFAVSTSLARFVDLGTEFTIKLNAERAFDLYVFEGLVELQVDQRFGEKAHQPLRIAEVRAVHFDAQDGDVVALPFNQGEKMPF